MILISCRRRTIGFAAARKMLRTVRPGRRTKEKNKLRQRRAFRFVKGGDERRVFIQLLDVLPVNRSLVTGPSGLDDQSYPSLAQV